MEDESFDRVSVLKEELDLASICESGAEFEVSDIKNVEPSCFDERFVNKFADNFNSKSYEDTSESFEKLAVNFHGITEDDLVMKQIFRQGSGPVVPPASSVVVHYIAYLEYADEPFDSSRKRKNALKFDLGDSSVIEGFGISVSTMRKGEVSKFLISPEYAFGSRGCPPRVPEDATCLYIIELIDFKIIEDGAREYFNLPMSQRNYAPLDVVLKALSSIRNDARTAYVKNNFRESVRLFAQALAILNDYNKKDEEEENLLKPDLIKLHVNVALCSLKMMHSARAIKHCNEALILDENNLKALFFKGKALTQLGDFERAIRPLRKANSLKPGKEVQSEIEKVERYVKMFCNPISNDKSSVPDSDLKSTQIKNCSNQAADEEVITSWLNTLTSDENLSELQFHSHQLTQKQLQVLKTASEEKNLLMRTFRNGLGEEIIHLQKNHPKQDSNQS